MELATLLTTLIFIFLLAVAMMSAKPEGFMAGLLYSNFADGPEPSAKGILPAAPGIPNSVIPNAPAPPNVGIVSNIQPVDNEANFVELNNKIRNLQGSLPEEIKRQISTLTPTIVNGMIQERNCQYSQF
jgi:hypothetical protein